jgi:hypothetical protein
MRTFAKYQKAGAARFFVKVANDIGVLVSVRAEGRKSF